MKNGMPLAVVVLACQAALLGQSEQGIRRVGPGTYEVAVTVDGQLKKQMIRTGGGTDPWIKAHVLLDAGSGLYDYSYVVGNKATAIQSIQTVVLPNRVPAEFASTPTSWQAARSSAEVSLVASDELRSIRPGGSVELFRLKSSALPGLVLASVRGAVPPLDFAAFSEVDRERLRRTLASGDRNSVWTVAPAIVDEPGVAAEIFIARIGLAYGYLSLSKHAFGKEILVHLEAAASSAGTDPRAASDFLTRAKELALTGPRDDFSASAGESLVLCLERAGEKLRKS